MTTLDVLAGLIAASEDLTDHGMNEPSETP